MWEWARVAGRAKERVDAFNRDWRHIVTSRFSRVWLFVTLWTAARQASLSMGILQARILEWAAISFSRGSSWPSICCWTQPKQKLPVTFTDNHSIVSPLKAIRNTRSRLRLTWKTIRKYLWKKKKQVLRSLMSQKGVKLSLLLTKGL